MKKGIYRSFNEFKLNAPSLALICDVDTVSKHYQFFQKLVAYKLDMEKADLKAIDSIFGFCDGEHVFINEYFPNTRKKTVFYKLENIGRYCFYYSVTEDVYTSVIHPKQRKSYNCHLEQNALSLKTGRIYILDKQIMEELIQKDAELLTEFKQDPERKKHFKEYLIRFSQRNKLP